VLLELDAGGLCVVWEEEDVDPEGVGRRGEAKDCTELWMEELQESERVELKR
jgi:hypothetical protein